MKCIFGSLAYYPSLPGIYLTISLFVPALSPQCILPRLCHSPWYFHLCSPVVFSTYSTSLMPYPHVISVFVPPLSPQHIQPSLWHFPMVFPPLYPRCLLDIFNLAYAISSGDFRFCRDYYWRWWSRPAFGSKAKTMSRTTTAIRHKYQHPNTSSY